MNKHVLSIEKHVSLRSVFQLFLSENIVPGNNFVSFIYYACYILCLSETKNRVPRSLRLCIEDEHFFFKKCEHKESKDRISKDAWIHKRIQIHSQLCSLRLSTRRVLCDLGKYLLSSLLKSRQYVWMYLPSKQRFPFPTSFNLSASEASPSLASSSSILCYFFSLLFMYILVLYTLL